jgi:DNA-directed RNA polymerase specialized sigma24 family protein
MATLPPPPDDLSPEQLFLGNLELIEAVIAHTCRRSHLSSQDAEDFGGYVWVKLIEDNYSKIREYQGRGSFKTYLTIVIRRLLVDYRNHLWGKWRNTAEALRLGPVALRLETLLVREGYTFEEACQILRTNEKVVMSDLELAELRGKLPLRIPRHFIGEEYLQAEPSPGPGPDDQLQDHEWWEPGVSNLLLKPDPSGTPKRRPPKRMDPQAVAARQEWRLESARRAFLREFGTPEEPKGDHERLRQERRIFALTYRGATYVPNFQFDNEGRPRSAVAQVIKLLGKDTSDWGLALWFTAANGWLNGKRPVDLLKDDPREVVQAAEREAAELVF